MLLSVSLQALSIAFHLLHKFRTPPTPRKEGKHMNTLKIVLSVADVLISAATLGLLLWMFRKK